MSTAATEAAQAGMDAVLTACAELVQLEPLSHPLRLQVLISGPSATARAHAAAWFLPSSSHIVRSADDQSISDEIALHMDAKPAGTAPAVFSEAFTASKDCASNVWCVGSFDLLQTACAAIWQQCSTDEKWLSAADAAWKRALPEEAWQAHGIAAAAWRASGTQVAEWRASGERAGWQRHVSCSHASAKPGMCALPTVFAVPRADTVFPCASTSSTSEAMAKALGEASASCLLPAQLRLLLGGLRAAAHSSGASVLVCHAGVPEQAAQAAQAAVGTSAWHRMLLEHTARHGKDAQAASAWEYIAAQLPVAVLDDALQLRVYAGLDCEPAIAAFAGDVAVDADSLSDLPRSLPLQAADAEPRAVYEQGGAGPWRVLPAERAPTAPTLPSEAAWLADMLPKHPNAQHRPLPAGTDVDAAVLACVQELVSGDFIPTTDAAARPSPTRAAKASRVSSLPQQSAGSDDEYGVPSSRAGRAASQVDSRASPAASAGPTPTSAAASAANPAAFWQSMMAGGGAPSSRTRSKRTAATVGKRTPK